MKKNSSLSNPTQSSPTKEPYANQNPQQLPCMRDFKKLQLSLQDRFDTQMIRVKVKQHQRMVQSLFTLPQQDLMVAMMSYETLPSSPISINSLIQLKSCKLIKSSQDKIYLGETLNKKKHGLGVAIYRDGKVYEGRFQNNQRVGYGVEVYSNDNIYIGDFHHNKKHGKGIFFWYSLCEIPCTKNSQILIQQYKGNWWGGLPDGKGEHYRANGDIYFGDFKNGLKHGSGIQKYANGDSYQGDFVNGLSQGNGQYSWRDGSEYVGDFKQGYRNGYGIWRDSKRMQSYKGHYMLDKKHGYGVYDWGNEYVYKGNYLEDERSGEGQLLVRKEVIYQGRWVNGEKEEEQETPQMRRSAKFEPGKIYQSQLAKSTYANVQDTKNKDHYVVSIQKRIQTTGNQSNPRINTKKSQQSLQQNHTQQSQQSRYQKYQITFKQQEPQTKVRIGHRNCIPCQQLKDMKKEQQSRQKKFSHQRKNLLSGSRREKEESRSRKKN